MSSLRRLSALSMLIILLSFAGNQTALSQTSKPYLSDPSYSPDGNEIAFVSGGDIWTVASAGGEARLLVSNPAMESRPLYSPDGNFLAFGSNRTGNGDIYILSFKTGDVSRLTFDDAGDVINNWSGDSKYIYFHSTSKDISGMNDLWRIKASGGTAMAFSDNRYVSEYQSSPSPDGKTIAFAARGIGSSQWWRKGRSHLDESEIWLLEPGASKPYTRMAEEGAKQLWPMWSADGKLLYYVSDRSGQQNLWSQPVGGTAKQLTKFNNGRVLWPSISAKGDNIVFERDFSIWNYSVAKGEAKQISITLKGVPATPATERIKLSSQFGDLAVSPDSKKAAFIARGEVFVVGTKDGGDATRITNTGAIESEPVWASNSNKLFYISDRNGSGQLFQYDFISGKESQLTSDKEDDFGPVLSPDGKMIAFTRGGSELKVLDIESKKETLISKASLGNILFNTRSAISWSPDNKWIAFAAWGAKSLRNIYVAPVTGGEAKPISFIANAFGGSVYWAKDGKSVFFTSAQRTENTSLVRIDLVPQQPRFKEDQFRDMFTDNSIKEAPPKPSTDTTSKAPVKKSDQVKIIWDGIHERSSLVSTGVNVNDIALSKDGLTLAFTANVAGQTNLYTWSLDELSKEPAILKQITSSPGGKGDLQFSADGKDIYYLESGRIQSVSVDSKTVKPISASAEVEIDFNKDKYEMFKQAWDLQNKGFYDPGFHGADWNAVKSTYEPLAAGAKTPDELRRILNLMVGELNASHSGIGAPGVGVTATGKLGVRFNRAAFENDGKLTISELIALSPAALADLKTGDQINAIDGIPVTGSSNIDQLLDNKIGKRVTLTINPAGGGGSKEVVLKPVSLGTEKGLIYKQWVKQNRDYVLKESGGRLGYVHMIDMGQGSLDQLYLDLDAENHAREGVVVDIRNNNGGFVNAYAIDVLARRGYLTMTPRGMPSGTGRTQLGQRALDAPTILLTNQHSLSDAEDFTEGYRTLGLGKVVGEPTGGWIIFTSGTSLIDGTSIRLPGIKITDHNGKDMELNPRPVDIPVMNALGDNGDAQLQTAIKELLKQIDRK